MQSLNDPVCNDAVISMNGATMPLIFHQWGNIADTTTVAFSPFTVKSVCPNLLVFYSAQYKNASGVWTALPATNFEISFNANTRVFTVTKCGPYS